MNPDVIPLSGFDTDSMDITAPLPHSPPAKRPWEILKNTSIIGDRIPTDCQVGRRPVAKVAQEKPMIVISMALFLPTLSPKTPNKAPPRGLTTRVAA